MQEVEEAEGLRGRKYYGAFDDDGEYRVCVEFFREDDDPSAFGLAEASPAGATRASVGAANPLRSMT